MKYPFALMLLGFLGLGMGAFAQGDTPENIPAYRLREPVAVEFVEALPNFEAVFFSTNDNQAAQLIWATETEFLMRFGETATFDELRMAFDRFRPQVVYLNYRDRIPAIDMNKWIARLLERWLSENPTDLSSVESINAYPFAMTVEAHDFDLDGDDEWILDVQYLRGEDVIYRNFLVADGGLSQYNILPLPIPYLSDGSGWSTEVSSDLGFNDLGLRDITADGQMEWLFSVGEFGPGGPGYFGTIFTMYALGWRDGEIVQVYRGPGTVQNTDDDAALEFSNNVIVRDNWLCGTQTSQIWDWDGAEYVRQPDRIGQADCTARQAEEAMWAGDFKTATERYETFFEQSEDRWAQYIECLSAGDYVCSSGLWTQIYYYFMGRRIIAYALLGDTARAQQLLEEATSYRRGGFVDALVTADTLETERLCRAAYDYFTSRWRIDPSDSNQLLPGIIVANINDGWDHYIGFVANPARSGCDIALFSGTPTPTPTVTPTPHPTAPPPTPDTRSLQEQWIDYQSIYNAFQAGDYETARIIVEHAVPQDDLDAARWLYWRALVYEVLDQPDDALNEYINLYLNYPGSWWARLAGLHLEKVEP
jgi:tetratricopeptide (TPR) repeat protein